MPAGWKSMVYRTDLEKKKFVGFFFDDAQAQTWVKKQTEGTFEVTTEKPRGRAAEEAANV